MQREIGFRRDNEKASGFIAESEPRILDRKTVERATARSAVLQNIAQRLEKIGIVLFGAEAQSYRAVLRAHAGDLYTDQSQPTDVQMALNDRRGVEIEDSLGRLRDDVAIGIEDLGDRKSTRLNSSHIPLS